MKKVLLVLVLIGVAIALAVFFIRRNVPAQPPIDGYTLASVEYGSLRETISATGVVRPQEEVIIGSGRGAGIVVKISADFNQEVFEGDELLRFDDQPAQEALQKARQAVELAKAGVTKARLDQEAAEHQLERQKKLPEGVGKKYELEAAEDLVKSAKVGLQAAQLRVKLAETELNQAETAVRNMTVRVPHINREGLSAIGELKDRDGASMLVQETPGGQRLKRKFVVLERKVELNQQIVPQLGLRLFTLAGDLSKMRVNAQVAESDIASVHKGQEVDFTVGAYAEEELHFSGRIVEVRLQPSTVQSAIYYETVIEVDNRRNEKTNDWLLRPGMTASVDIIRRKRDGIWKLPLAALTTAPDEKHQSEAAREKLAVWSERPDRKSWDLVWIIKDSQPWPIFVHLSSDKGSAEESLHDAQFHEIIQWDPELKDSLKPDDPESYPRVIVGLPQAKGGFFKVPSFRF